MSIHSECTSLRKEIELTLDKACSRINYGGYKDYQFSFECPLHANGNHLCVINRNELSPKVMTCLLDRDDPESVVLRSCHLIWFDQVKVLFFYILLFLNVLYITLGYGVQ